MATYVQKRSRMFMERPEWLRPVRRRSESRLKTYPSSVDIRTWGDVVENRRQHILELVRLEYEKCTTKIIPIDVLVDMLLAMANADIAKLKNCLKKLWSFINGLNLAEGDLVKLREMAKKMDQICLESSKLSDDDCEPTCVASKRHLQEQAEIEKLVEGTVTPTVQAQFKGPGKMVTRIKGLQPGFQVVNDPSRRTHTIIKPGKVESFSRKPPTDNLLKPKSEPDIQNEDMDLLEPPPPEVQAIKKSPSGPGNDAANSSGESNEPTLDKMAALDALCKEQQDKIQALTMERDGLKTKLEACLKELDSFKKLQTVANPSLPPSCQQEIEALEAEIKIMRSGNPSPEEEADIIKKEVEVLKRYCSKLKEVENENEKLKVELGSRDAIKEEPKIEDSNIETLKDKLKNLEDLTKERDELANKVHTLEKQLLQYQNLPGDVEVLRSKSNMLDEVMQERDSMCKKVKFMKGLEEEVKQLRKKAERVDELERELKNMSKGDRSSGLELRKTQSRAGSLEIELQNLKSERDAMRKRIDLMKKDSDSQKVKATEVEMLRLERDRLQIKLNELADIQTQYEDMMKKLDMFDAIKAERDMYKQKYEQVLDMECKCEMLKNQIEEARSVTRERDHLQKQVQDLEACICEQEDEIKNLVLQVDSMSKTRNTDEMFYKQEVARKDTMLGTSPDQLPQRIKELEKLLHRAEHMNLQKDCHIKCLENELNSKTGSINASKKLNRSEMESVELMRKELQAAKAENQRLQEIANKMLSINGDDHVKKVLKQSECAVKRVVQELGKQYKEWDHSKPPNPRGKFANYKKNCVCNNTGGEISSGDDCEKLKDELEELQREKQKLEMAVKQLQGEGIRSKNSKCPCVSKT